MLYEQIKIDLKDAMRSKDTDKRDVLKLVIDKARAIMKEKNPHEVSENIPDDVIISAIEKEVKQMNQTLEILSSAENGKNTNDLNSKSFRLNFSRKFFIKSHF